MTRSEAEKLLGGHATGTLTEDERRQLFAAALGDQALFDALLDEEALRELLADPALKAQLLAALAPAAAPKVVPFWRRTGVLGAAASLLVAATAGLVVLRSPERVPPPLEQEREQPAKAKAAEAPPVPQAPASLARRTAPAPPAQDPAPVIAPPPPVTVTAAAPTPASVRPMSATLAAGAPAPKVEEGTKAKEQDLYRRAEAQDKVAKKTEAPRPSAAAVEVVAEARVDQQKRKAAAQNAAAGAPVAVPGGVVGGVVGGVLGGAISRPPAEDQAGRLREDAPPAAPAPAKPLRRVEWKAAAGFAPTWSLAPQPDGSTRVLVKGPAGATAVLLRRGGAGIEVLTLKVVDSGGDTTRWRAETRLAQGDVLDLYLLNAPVADPARLPETGPVDGFRTRIHPASKN